MKAITKTMTNGEIYQYAVALMNASFNDNEVYMPAAVSFAIQKNKTALTSTAEDVEKGRMAIIEHYSNGQTEEGYTIPPESVEKANSELNDLLNIEQEVKIYMFDIDSLNDIKLTSAQMQAIMFMIED